MNHHVARDRSGRHRHLDQRCGPTADRCRRPVELDRAGTLSRSEIRSIDRHRCPDGSRSGRQTRDVRSCYHREGHTVAGIASHRDHDVARGRSRRDRRDNGRSPPTADSRRRRPIELDRARSCVDPKFNPVIVTDAPTAPDVGDRLVILGNTVNDTPLLSTPLA